MVSISEKKNQKEEVVKKPDFAFMAINAELEKAKKSKGYLITITRLEHESADGLKHTYFTDNFLSGDIYPSLEKLAKLLEPEAQKIDKEPEYKEHEGYEKEENEESDDEEIIDKEVENGEEDEKEYGER